MPSHVASPKTGFGDQILGIDGVLVQNLATPLSSGLAWAGCGLFSGSTGDGSTFREQNVIRVL
jgi:hypothetical protein